MKYPIGLKLTENVTMLRYEAGKDKRRMIAVCTCGKEIVVTTSTIKRMKDMEAKTNSSGCCDCVYRQRSEQRINPITMFGDIYNRYKKGARHRKIFFDLTLEESANLFSANCAYCGASPAGSYSTSKYYKVPYNGIDRINTKEGYVIGNVTSACRSCNVAKHEKTVDEFLLHIHKIYTFNSQRLEQLLVDSSESKQKVSILESDIV